MTPDDDDGRDERLAELLEVPPLDDVTRRRLVRRALDEPRRDPGPDAAPPGRSSPPRPRWSSLSLRPRSCSATTVATPRRRTATAPRSLTRPRRAQPTRRRPRRRRPTSATSGRSPTRPCYATAWLSAPPPHYLRVSQRLTSPASPGPRDSVSTDRWRLSASGTYQGAPVDVFVGPKGGIDTAFVTNEACEVIAEVPLV